MHFEDLVLHNPEFIAVGVAAERSAGDLVVLDIFFGSFVVESGSNTIALTISVSTIVTDP